MARCFFWHRSTCRKVTPVCMRVGCILCGWSLLQSRRSHQYCRDLSGAYEVVTTRTLSCGCGKSPRRAGKQSFQGLKPNVLWSFTARLKPCPDTKQILRASPCGTVFHDSSRKQSKRTVPQRLKPRVPGDSMARLKPCPSLKSVPHSIFIICRFEFQLTPSFFI